MEYEPIEASEIGSMATEIGTDIPLYVKIFGTFTSICTFLEIPILIVIFILTIVFIQKNLEADKNKNKIIRYGLTKLVICAIPLFIVLTISKALNAPSFGYAIDVDIEEMQMKHAIRDIILFIIYLALLFPQIHTLINLHRNLKEDVEKIEETSEESVGGLIFGTIALYIILFVFLFVFV